MESLNNIAKLRLLGIRRFIFITLIFLVSIFLNTTIGTNKAEATDYNATLNVSSSIVLNSTPDKTTVHTESVNVVSSCTAGYNLTVSTSATPNLYQDGDASNQTGVFTPVNPAYALSDKTNNANTWGYSLSTESGAVDIVGAYNPLSTTPAFIRTVAQTATEQASIDDTFNLYYGVNTAVSTPKGSYLMPDNGTIVYQLTLAESCSDTLETTFYPNTEDTVTNMPTNADNTIDTTNHTVTLSNKVPARTGYIFKEWNTSGDGTGTTYQPNQTVSTGPGGLSGFLDLYAIWTAECPSGYICYDGNHADEGTMPNQEATNGTNNVLIASNFSRDGYGFLGWSTNPNATPTSGDTIYGPNQNFAMPASGGVNLFAVWLESSGTLQTWHSPGKLNTGDVIALKDNRDNEVYMISKLADGNVWITENLRLVPNNVTITADNTHNPTSTFLAQYPSSSSSTGQCYDDLATCVDQINFNAHNLDRTLTPLYNGNSNGNYWYSYGVMYNWYTATAGNGDFAMASGNAAGDLCPAGWHLPTGGASGEWGVLASNMAGGNSAAKAATLRAYPNNFLYSGDYNPSKDSPDGVGRQGRLWSTTPVSSNSINAYRMGYNSSAITAGTTTANSWNKWDNFAIRCIYQGGNLTLVDTDVTFAGSGVTSVTFHNETYGDETATTSSSTVPLVENVPYEITAITSAGYEFSSWATTATGTLVSTSTNPTTYTVSDDSTLTVTGVSVPSYTVTVTLPEHVTSIAFTHPDYSAQTVTTDGDTVTLKQGVPYTITATFEEGFSVNNWTSGANSTLSSNTANPTTFTVTGNSTLSLVTKEAELLTYNLHYDAGSGAGVPADATKTSHHNPETFTIDNSSIPSLFGYHFIGYSETVNSSTAEYAYDSTNNTFTPSTIDIANNDPGTSTTTTKTLYAVYAEDACPAGYICYFDNGADNINGGKGTMANQAASSNSSATLIPSNYSKTGYGFAGWLTDANDTTYGPGATITTGDLSTSGLKLYAKWVASAGDMQTWNGCNSLAQGAVTALTDTRDNQTYAVAKLADDNCWTIENLRLDPATATTPISSTNTHNPSADFITALTAAGGNTLSNNTLCNEDSDACFNQIQYNTNNLNRSLTQSYTAQNSTSAWYGYGVYYNWYTATAGNGLRSTAGDTTVDGDLCPINWHVPTGNSTGEFNVLNTAINNGSTSSDAGWRAYPNNFVWSGDYNNTKRKNVNSNGRIWTSTAKSSLEAYRVGFASNTVTASTNAYEKWDAFIIRCMRDEGTAVYSNVTVTLPTGIDSITFQSSKYGTVTATSQNPTVSIVQDATYTITANESVGYEFTVWQAGTGSTIGDASTNPTTIIITDDTTLTATTLAIPSYQATVTIDEGVTSLGIYNASYGTQTFTPANMTDNGDGTYSGTATLYRNIEYIVTGVYATSYEFVSWSTGTNGNLADATSATTTYTVTGNSTLTLTSQESVPPNCASSPTISTVAPGITYMQDINSSNYNTVVSNMATTTSYKIKDNRDGQNYCIAKLADNKVWMTSNLNIAGGTALSADDTDVTSAYISSFSTNNNLTKTGDTIVLPASSTSGFDTENYSYVYNSGNKTNNCASPGCYSYYSWDAATLGSGRSISTDNTDAEQSICPKGWKLPTARTTSASNWQSADFYAMAHQYGLDSTTSTSESDNGFYTQAGPGTTPNFLLAGYYYDGSFYDGGSYGSYWSSASGSSTSSARNLYFYSSYVSSAGGTNRRYGFSVRCLLDQPTHTVTVSLDSHISSVTFDDGANTQVATSTNPTVSLKQSKSYTITATPATGYEFSSWSTTGNGSLGSTSTNPTTYTVTDAATLTATSQVIPSYTTTVNIAGSGISSVSFVNADYGTQNVTTSGGTVSLRRGVSYTITATAITDYELASWSTTGNGTLGSTNANPTTYTVTDTATLTVTGQEIPATFTWQASTATRPADADVRFMMQDFDTATCNLGTKGQIGWVKDSRDNTVYTIGKLADGKCWMLENLNIAGGTALSADDTDVTSAYISSFSTSNNLTKTGDTIVLPASSTSGFDTNNYSYVYNSGNKTNCGASGQNTPCYSYYSWDAATLGSGRTLATENTDAPQSICPKGWRLPTSGNSSNNEWKRGDFYALASAYHANLVRSYDEDSATFYNMAGPGTTPNFLLAGFYHGGSFSDGGSYGYYWSSTSSSHTDYARILYFYFRYVGSANYYRRGVGFSVRCLLRD